MDLTLITAAERPELRQKDIDLNDKIWSEFMFQDAISNKWFSKLYVVFPEFQLWLLDGEEMIAVANSIPLEWSKDPVELPDTGWDWAIEKGFQDHTAARKTNTLCGLLIAISPAHRGKGISNKMLELMKEKAQSKGFSSLIIPVRPSLKSENPTVAIGEYVKWKREDGQLYDPWLRVHIKNGAEIIKVCHKAMNITGTVKNWESWTGMEFPSSGEYIVKGALVPVKIDLEKNRGTYIEPNVWVRYEVKKIR